MMRLIRGQRIYPGIPDQSDQSGKESERRNDLPDEASIVHEKPFVSSKGKTYRIIRTNEGDEYDPPEDPKNKQREG